MGYISKGDRITASEQDIIDVIGALGTPLYYLRINAAGTNVEWSSVAGGGDVSKVGTPVNNQVGVWTGDGTLEGDTALTFSAGVLSSTGLLLSGLTASEIVITDASKNLVSAAVATYPSLTELTYLKGVTSAIQTQIGTKMANPMTTGGDVIYGGASGTPTRLANGTAGQVLTSAGTTLAPTWTTIADSGDVAKVGTPVDNQIGVWTGDGTIEGGTTLTFDGDTLSVTNNNETGAATALIVQGDRATPTTNDEVIIELRLSDSAGNQDTMGTIRAQALDVTSTSEDSQLKFGTMSAGTLASRLALTSTQLGPNSDDGIALGSTALRWSDLYLAEGGVINWDNGDMTLTQAGNILTVAGGDLALGANSLTITGSIAATGARVTKGWFTDIESTNMPTVGGTAILTSLTAPQFTTIELGHASDTTIARVSAGVISVEGVTIPSISSTNTLTNKRITKRTGTTTSHATPTINTDNVDFYSITAQAEAITSMTTNLSGTPTENQTLWIAITGTAARAITWGASFEASTVALPTTTVTTARLDVGFVWNTVTSKWRCVASC